MCPERLVCSQTLDAKCLRLQLFNGLQPGNPLWGWTTFAISGWCTLRFFFFFFWGLFCRSLEMVVKISVDLRNIQTCSLSGTDNNAHHLQSHLSFPILALSDKGCGTSASRPHCLYILLRFAVATECKFILLNVNIHGNWSFMTITHDGGADDDGNLPISTLGWGYHTLSSTLGILRKARSARSFHFTQIKHIHPNPSRASDQLGNEDLDPVLISVALLVGRQQRRNPFLQCARDCCNVRPCLLLIRHPYLLSS